MTSNSTTPRLPQSEIETAEHLFDNWFDPVEAGLRDRVREFLELMFEGELDVLAKVRKPSGNKQLYWPVKCLTLQNKSRIFPIFPGKRLIDRRKDGSLPRRPRAFEAWSHHDNMAWSFSNAVRT